MKNHEEDSFLNDALESGAIQKNRSGKRGPKIGHKHVYLRTTPSGTDTLYIPNGVIKKYDIRRVYSKVTFFPFFDQDSHLILLCDRDSMRELIRVWRGLVEDNFYKLQFDGGMKFSGNIITKSLVERGYDSEGIFEYEVDEIERNSSVGKDLSMKILGPRKVGDEGEWVHQIKESEEE